MDVNLMHQLLILVGLVHYSLEICNNRRKCIKSKFNSCSRYVYVLECTDIEDFEGIRDDAEYLNISSSNIQEIQPGTLRYFSYLKILWMPNNKIILVEPGSFNGLRSLTELSLSTNEIEAIHRHVFTGMSQLCVLDLSHNQIQTIDSYSFSGTDNLKILYMNDNLIYNMGELTEIKNLELLDLSNNRLEDLQFVKSCTKLRTLNVAHNNLSRFSGGKLISATTSLDLSHNNISYIQRSDLENLNELVKLNLSRNPLFEESDMQVDLFQDRNLLKVLNISSTSIKKLSVGVFTQMRSLEVLDLSSNSLSYLPNSIFHGLKSLKELYLGENQLSYFYYDGSTLNKLDLNENLWNCDLLGGIITKLSTVEVLRGNSFNTTNIYGIACVEEIKDFRNADAYNSSGTSDLHKEYLSHLIKTQTDLREILAQLKTFMEQSALNIPDLKDILNETSIHLQGLGDSMRQRKFDEENLLGNFTDAFRSLSKLVNELATLRNETYLRETFEANNDNTMKQLIMELKNNNFLSTKIDMSSIKSLQTMQNDSFKADPSPATNKGDNVALYLIVVILVAILCFLVIKQYGRYKHSATTREENNPLNALVA